MSALATVDAEWLVDRIARRVVELLDERAAGPPAGQLVDAATLARLLGVSRSTVYDRAAELGAIELGDGARPRLRFDPVKARETWTARHSSEEADAELPAPAAPRGGRGGPSGVKLLPVRGSEAA